MKHFMQYFQIGDVLITSGNFVQKTGEGEMKKVTNYLDFSKPGSRFPNPKSSRFTKFM